MCTNMCTKTMLGLGSSYDLHQVNIRRVQQCSFLHIFRPFPASIWHLNSHAKLVMLFIAFSNVKNR